MSQQSETKGDTPEEIVTALIAAGRWDGAIAFASAYQRGAPSPVVTRHPIKTAVLVVTWAGAAAEGDFARALCSRLEAFDASKRTFAQVLSTTGYGATFSIDEAFRDYLAAEPARASAQVAVLDANRNEATQSK